MYKVELSAADALQHAAIDRRRRMEKERQARIFNPKFRVMGIDVQALEEQIKLKKDEQEEERKRLAAFDKQAEEANMLLTHLDHQSDVARRNQAKKIADYRHLNQKHTERREYHLSDPNSLKKEKRLQPDDLTHYSNMQSFAGGDKLKEERVVEQHQQVKTWTIQSIQEKKKAQQKEAEEKKRFEEYQENVAAKARELERLHKHARSEMEKALLASNLEMAAAKAEKKAKEKQKEEELNIQEMVSQLNGKLLNESNDPQKCMGDVDTTIQMIQVQKRAEKIRKEREKKHAMAWAEKQNATNKALLVLEQQLAEKKRLEAIEIRNENMRRAQEARTKKSEKDTDMAFHPDFFDQFNRGSR